MSMFSDTKTSETIEMAIASALALAHSHLQNEYLFKRGKKIGDDGEELAARLTRDEYDTLAYLNFVLEDVLEVAAEAYRECGP